ncbi:MAG: hypothetical protein QOE53_157, partial [Pseudonocardiales bacterium]|nr:hypothetical protein [Pseudonocardiales bacterium]
IPKAEAVRLLETLQWRGISFFPLQPGGSGLAPGGT